MKTATAALILLAGAVAACSTSPLGDQLDDGQPRPGIGERVGSLIGLGDGGETVSRSERSAALVAAGGRPLSVADTKAAMDKAEADLKAKAGRNTTVSRVGDQVIISIPSDAIFGRQRDKVGRSIEPALNDIATVLGDNPQTTVDVYGYTDTNGTEAENFDLSQKRALAVANYLAGKGVDPKRFAVTGFGETRPAATNDTSDGRAKNRRVEIQLSPLT